MYEPKVNHATFCCKYPRANKLIKLKRPTTHIAVDSHAKWNDAKFGNWPFHYVPITYKIQIHSRLNNFLPEYYEYWCTNRVFYWSKNKHKFKRYILLVGLQANKSDPSDLLAHGNGGTLVRIQVTCQMTEHGWKKYNNVFVNFSIPEQNPFISLRIFNKLQVLLLCCHITISKLLL